MVHKERKEEELADGRLLKPSTWSEELRCLDPEKKGPSSNCGKKPLDLNAPLLSVRRNRGNSVEQASSSSSSNSRSRHSRRSSSFGVSQRQSVPFFTWEQPPIPPPKISVSYEQEDHGYGSRALVLAPPPETSKNKKKQAENFLDFADARSDFAHTEVMSVAPTYMVSENLEDDEDEERRCGGKDGEVEEFDQDRAMVEYNAENRELIMQRFLPAAKAVAREMEQQDQRELARTWRPLIAHPSPQGQQYRKRAEEQQQIKPERQKERKSFAELMKMQDKARRGGRIRRGSDLGEGEFSSQRYATVVGSGICGFFPLLRMLHASCKESKSTSPTSKQKLTLEREDIPGDGPSGDGDDQSSGTEWWSDEGDIHGEDVDDVIDHVDDQSSELWMSSSSYLACKYTPSRGGLRSPAMVESKGFLGMPRDRRRAGSTFIKRMYPIVKSERTDKAMISTTTTPVYGSATTSPWMNGHESDSSESLMSIQLGRLSRATSRQNSDGGMEKVFCLDTLDQMRQGDGVMVSPAGKVNYNPSRRKNGFQDERCIHPQGEVRSDQPVAGSAQLAEGGSFLCMASKTKTIGATTKNAAVRQLDHPTEESKFRSKSIVCWRDEDGPEENAASSATIALPVPRGPAESWLKEKLVKPPGKPPLARKKMVSTRN